MSINPFPKIHKDIESIPFGGGGMRNGRLHSIHVSVSRLKTRERTMSLTQGICMWPLGFLRIFRAMMVMPVIVNHIKKKFTYRIMLATNASRQHLERCSLRRKTTDMPDNMMSYGGSGQSREWLFVFVLVLNELSPLARLHVYIVKMSIVSGLWVFDGCLNAFDVGLTHRGAERAREREKLHRRTTTNDFHIDKGFMTQTR